jgi:sec-independent protein translocase protein TatC
MNGPQDRRPDEAPAPRGAPGLSDEERRKLGPPPGAQIVAAKQAAEAEEGELARLEKDLDEVEQYRMPLMEHLIELRDRLVKSALALVLGFGIGYAYSVEAINFLTVPFVAALEQTGHDGGLSVNNTPFEAFVVIMKVAFIVGLVLASPVLSWQAWQFVAPGLYKTERRVVAPLALSSVALFWLGGAFCYYFMFPVAYPLLINLLQVEINLSIDAYLVSTIYLMLAFGLCFQMPVVAFFLARVGILDHRDLAAWWRPAIVGISIVAAIVTPPDVISQIAIGVPMVFLYGVSIGIAWMFSTKQRTPPLEEPA